MEGYTLLTEKENSTTSVRSPHVMKLLLEEYKIWIESLAANEERMVFLNSGPDHAAIVISTIFKYAKKEVNIYAGKMDGGISSQECYQVELKNFLKRSGKIKMILQEYEPGNNASLFGILNLYKFYDPDQVQIRVTDKILKNSDSKLPIHFCLGDNKMYRVEEDIVNFTATGSFNDEAKNAKLKELFNTIFSNSQSA